MVSLLVSTDAAHRPVAREIAALVEEKNWASVMKTSD